MNYELLKKILLILACCPVLCLGIYCFLRLKFDRDDILAEQKHLEEVKKLEEQRLKDENYRYARFSAEYYKKRGGLN